MSLGHHKLRYIRILVFFYLYPPFTVIGPYVQYVRCSYMPVASREETMTGLCYLKHFNIAAG